MHQILAVARREGKSHVGEDGESFSVLFLLFYFLGEGSFSSNALISSLKPIGLENSGKCFHKTFGNYSHCLLKGLIWGQHYA